jgi:hypothetical protein
LGLSFGEFPVIPDAYWIEDYPDHTIDWPIEGLLCPYITILSGQPKVGKSTISLHMVISMITGEPFLGRSVNLAKQKVAWMGFDSGWVNELRNNSRNKTDGALLLQNPLTSLVLDDWRMLGNNLIRAGIGYLVIDHLYGLGGHLNLNENQEASKIMNCLQVLVREYQIPILLLAQATKNQQGSGSMAHSNLFKGNARVLLELSGTRRDGKRSLKVSGNEVASETIQVYLGPLNLDLAQKEMGSETKQNRDFDGNIRKVDRIIAAAQPGDLENSSTAGRLACKIGLSVNDEAGRKMVARLVNKGLMVPGPEGLIKAENCVS